MNKFFVAGIAATLFFASCEQSGSSTIGTYENDETSPTAEKKEGASGEHSSDSETSNAEISADTAKSITGVRKDSVSSTNKNETETAADKKKVKAEKTKHVD